MFGRCDGIASKTERVSDRMVEQGDEQFVSLVGGVQRQIVEHVVAVPGSLFLKEEDFEPLGTSSTAATTDPRASSGCSILSKMKEIIAA